ncbi:helix-turn-helix domain-containing protein [Streptomyces aurantiacus]|uniref:XRE family transcriptional regulator n=1 Tax=Streptomyces aurantiacus TaxID=47760 RepID=A0A7G1NSG0_9ACTN|nr:XRE family transcriptional regulator [Streptomyces aurantiacus]BCL25472.1 hypothetical protein GCM10017557_03310 [Streptomyces aurantiacus]
MGTQGELSPYEARNAAGFIALLQQLKERSGLTYRQLEERAARSGDVLARSTLADILRRTSLPRPDVLAAFVRACGDGRRVDAWLDARARIAADAAAAPDVVPGAAAGAVSDTGSDADARPRAAVSTRTWLRWTRGRTVALAASAPLLALVAWGLLPDSSGGAGAAVSPADGWVTIRPARTSDLCLTDGRDRGGVYGSAVAVQLACARATVPRTFLEPAGEGLYRIQWHHPQLGKGCLTVMSTGKVKGMLEPRDDCDQATLFQFEATGAESTGGFRLRPATSSRCVGIAGNDTAEGAEAVEERCTGAADQRFLVRAG